MKYLFYDFSCYRFNMCFFQALYSFCDSIDLKFLPWRTWVGIWTFIISLVVAFFQVFVLFLWGVILFNYSMSSRERVRIRYGNLFQNYIIIFLKIVIRLRLCKPESFNTNISDQLLTTKINLLIHNTRIQIQRVILYTNTGFNRSVWRFLAYKIKSY